MYGSIYVEAAPNRRSEEPAWDSQAHDAEESIH
jgi:hypothetical protein